MASLGDTEVTPGQVLADKFRIERILGRGGMGVVVAATHIHLDERVAIKFLLPEALRNPEAVKRFEREARAAVKIKSEHVARVTDVGTLVTGSPYMVMEYLNGLDLSQYLHERGPLPVEEAIDYVLQAIEAIAEAHSLGIIHRDLKPANLFRILRADGTPSIKVLDFGISKLTGSDSSMTQTSTMMGSPYYMSPEQMTSSKSVDPRTDVWALGVILYELLSGAVPFDGESVPEIVAKVLQNPVPELGRPNVPRELEGVLSAALAKDRSARYPDVASFAVALAPFGPAHARTSVQRVSRVLGISTDITLPDGAAQRPPREHADGRADTTFDGAARTDLNVPGLPKKSSFGLLLGAGLVLLAGAGTFVATSLPSGTEDPPAIGPATDGRGETPHNEFTGATDARAPAGQGVQQAGTQPPAPATSPSPAPAPSGASDKPSPSGDSSVAPSTQGSAAATASPSANSKTSPQSPKTNEKPKPATAKPSASTKPAPAAEPAPTPPPATPKPPKSAVDLFSDRK